MKSTNPFRKLLRGSPLRPIQEHMRVVQKGVALIPQLFAALKANDQEEISVVAAKIDEIESEADDLKTDYRAHMPSTLLMPVARRDLLMLIAEQDKIADKANAIGRILTYRKMEIPEACLLLLDELIEHALESYSQAANVIEQMDELMEGGFAGKESRRVRELIVKLQETEDSADKLLMKINHALFAIEDQLNPVDVMFWYKLIDYIDDISDRSENVGDRVLLLIARS